jgi:L-asparaginase
MTITPGPPPWPIPPSWTISPPASPPASPSASSASASQPASEPPARTVVVLCPDGSDARDVIDAVRIAPEVTVEARALPAPAPGFAGVYDLARAAAKATDEGAQGIVVAEATDTPEETAWALELLHAGDTPLVFAADPGDAADVADAISVAAADLGGYGCLFVTHGEIHSARHVSRSGVPAFSSPGAGPLGRVTDGTPRLLWRPPGRLTVAGPYGTRSPNVGLHTVAVGDDGRLLRAIAEHCDGLIVATPGTGRVPEAVISALAEPATRLPVILASSADCGAALPATTLDPLKARVLMHLLLDAGRSREAVLEAFATTDRPGTTRL